MGWGYPDTADQGLPRNWMQPLTRRLWTSGMWLTICVGSLLAPLLPQAYATTSSTTATVSLGSIATLDPQVYGLNDVVDEGTLFEGLFGFSPTYQIVPKIDESYAVTDGGRVWTFTLRRNAHWSNGQPVTASDFYYAWMRIASPSQTESLVWASVMNYVKNVASYQAGQTKSSAVGLRVLGPYRIQVTLTEPYDLLPILAMSGSMPLYPPVVRKHPNAWYLPRYFVGDGPFTVHAFVPNGTTILTRNRFYQGHAGEVNVGNEQTLRIVPAPSVPVESFLTGTTNLVSLPTTAEYHYALKHPALRRQLVESPEASVVGFEWDHAVAESPLDNLQVRQAVAMAINRRPIVREVLGGTAVTATTMGPSLVGATRFEHALPYNLAQAKKLLARAGYAHGRGLPTFDLYIQSTSTNSESLDVAEALAQELRSGLGVRFQIVPVTTGQWTDIVYDGLNPGVHPGYVISLGSSEEPAPADMTLQADDAIDAPGTLAGPSLRQYASQWYFDRYAADDVRALGNPADPSLGETLKSWAPLQHAIKTDVRGLLAFAAKAPSGYRALVTQEVDTAQKALQKDFRQWHTTTSPSAKHQLWEDAWNLLGSYSLQNGETHLGLNDTLYLDQHESSQLFQLSLETDQLSTMTAVPAAEHLAARIDNAIMQQGYEEPLYIPENIFLKSSSLNSATGNPYFWNTFEDLEYLRHS